MEENLTAELKVRLTESQMAALERVAYREGLKPSPLARKIIHMHLLQNDEEYAHVRENSKNIKKTNHNPWSFQKLCI